MEALDRYPWSGHGVSIGRVKNTWQEREYVLSQFRENRGKAVDAYQRFMAVEKDQGRRKESVREDWFEALEVGPKCYP